jgi:hypothetical protein
MITKKANLSLVPTSKTGGTIRALGRERVYIWKIR